MPETPEQDDITTIVSTKVDIGSRPSLTFRFGSDPETGEPCDYTARCPKGLAWTDASALFEAQRAISAAQKTLEEAADTGTSLEVNARAVLQATVAGAPTVQHSWLMLIEGEVETLPNGRVRTRGGFLRRAIADETAWSAIMDSLENDDDDEADVVALINIATWVYEEFEAYMAARWNRVGLRAPVSPPPVDEDVPAPKTVTRPKAKKPVGPKKPANLRR